MNIFEIFAMLASVLASHAALLQTAIGYITTGDWPGLMTWLESIIATPPSPAPDVSQLKTVVAGLKKAKLKGVKP